MSDRPSEVPGVYEAPEVEQVVTPEELARRVDYAGLSSNAV